MAICVKINSDDTLKATNASPQSCSQYVLVDANEYQLMIKTYDINALDIASSFTWGFATYIGFWWLSFVIKNAKQVIRKA